MDSDGVIKFVNNEQNVQQYVVGSLTLTDSTTGGSLTLLNQGHYDAEYTNLFTSLVAASNTHNGNLNGSRMAIRLGWEWAGTWSWGLDAKDPQTNTWNTHTAYVQAFQRVVGLARAAGWTGDFDWNGQAPSDTITDGGGTTVPYDSMFPGTAYGTGAQIVGIDVYDTIGNAAMYSVNCSARPPAFSATGAYCYGFNKNGSQSDSGVGTYDNVWNAEALPRLNSVAAFARSEGMLMGLGEIGDIIDPTNRFDFNQTNRFWPLMTSWLAANADVAAYAMPFNQNLYPTGTSGQVTQDDQYVFQGGFSAQSVPTSAWIGPTTANRTTGAAPPSLGSMTNADYTSTNWVDTTDPNKTSALAALKQYWKAGTMQQTPNGGHIATLVADVNGDGKADLVEVYQNRTTVSLSTGSGFAKAVSWSSVPFYGTQVTLAGDVTGDGKADLVAVNGANTFVMTSTGSAFSSPIEWSSVPFYGSEATLIGDVSGDGKADLVAVNGANTFVMTSTGSAFSSPAQWSSVPFFGTKVTLAADVSGDHKADLVAVNGDDTSRTGSTWVATSTGSSFSSPTQWSATPFWGSQATLAGDVTGDGKADLVAVNQGNTFAAISAGIVVQPARTVVVKLLLRDRGHCLG